MVVDRDHDTHVRTGVGKHLAVLRVIQLKRARYELSSTGKARQNGGLSTRASDTAAEAARAGATFNGQCPHVDLATIEWVSSGGMWIYL